MPVTVCSSVNVVLVIKTSWVFNYSIKSLEFSEAAKQQLINCIRFKQTPTNSKIACLWMFASVL